MIAPWKSHLVLFVLAVFLPGCTAMQAMQLVDGGVVVPGQYAESVAPFTLEGHPILIKARLNNSQKEYSFIFDTGALTLIRQEVARELDLPKGIEVEASDTGGKSKTIELVKLDNIVVGNMKVHDCAVGVSDFSGLFAPDIAGILGSNFFKHFNIILDYRNKNITFSRKTRQRAAQDKETRIPFESKMEMGFAPVVQCEVDGGLQDQAVIDTGFPGMVALPLSMVKKTISLKEGTAISAQGSMMGGIFGQTNEDYGLRIHELTLGALKLENIPATSHSLKAGRLLLGNKFLEKFVVTLNYPVKEMILTPYGTPFETNIPSYGLALAKENHKTIVSGIWNTSSAARSGIKIGDEVVKINSLDAQALSLMELIPLFLDENINSLEIEYLQGKDRQKAILDKGPLLPVLK
jgi:predicted aspartyl protease